MNYREEIINSLVDVCKKARSEGFDSAREIYTKQVDSGYKKGLEDAWECARKIVLGTDKGGIDVEDLIKIFDVRSAYGILESVSINDAMQKIKEYEQQKQDKKIDIRAKYEKYYIPIGEENMRRKREQREQVEKCEKCTKEISAKCVVDGCEFEPKQTDAPDINYGSIKVGDEVRMKGSDPERDDCDYGICTWSFPNDNTIYVMRRDGSSGRANKDEWYRTGRHFPQIAEVLEQLRGENE